MRSSITMAKCAALAFVVLALLVGCAGQAKADLIPVSASEFSGTTTTSFGSYSFSDPAPYGFSNNTNDVGWIWDAGDYFVVDFGAPTAVDKLQVWSVYGGGQRGATWEILFSDDGSTFTPAATFTYETTLGGGVNDDGTARTDFAGWYGINFNSADSAHRYWEVQDNATLVDHSPRSAGVQFFGPSAVPEPSTLTLLGVGAVGLLGYAGLRRTRARKAACAA